LRTCANDFIFVPRRARDNGKLTPMTDVSGVSGTYRKFSTSLNALITSEFASLKNTICVSRRDEFFIASRNASVFTMVLRLLLMNGKFNATESPSSTLDNVVMGSSVRNVTRCSQLFTSFRYSSTSQNANPPSGGSPRRALNSRISRAATSVPLVGCIVRTRFMSSSVTWSHSSLNVSVTSSSESRKATNALIMVGSVSVAVIRRAFGNTEGRNSIRSPPPVSGMVIVRSSASRGNAADKALKLVALSVGGRRNGRSGFPGSRAVLPMCVSYVSGTRLVSGGVVGGVVWVGVGGWVILGFVCGGLGFGSVVLVSPHVRGADGSMLSRIACPIGVHPHACGANRRATPTGETSSGSPPRLWGQLPPELVTDAPLTVHPHACGANA
jgi:hypothetical protein